MKKLKLLVMPLMVIPFLASCGNAGGGGGDDPKEKEWYEDTTYLNALTKADVTKDNGDGTIGVVRTLKVNGLDHKVRLIGVDEDYEDEAKTKPIHTTWEFVNLISDTEGYSLATQWNDTNVGTGAAFNYLDSSVRMALVGEKQDKGHILWAQKGQQVWSNEEDGPYTNKSVLDMIESGNPGFKSAVKSPSKYININVDNSWKEEAINDKLFLLSPFEMCEEARSSYEETKTVTYSYYSGHTSTKDIIKLKTQINEEEINEKHPSIPRSCGQMYTTKDIGNYAGCNYDDLSTNAGNYWLRSPYNLAIYDKAWAVGGWSSMSGITYSTVQDFAFGVAPAFCI